MISSSGPRTAGGSRLARLARVFLPLLALAAPLVAAPRDDALKALEDPADAPAEPSDTTDETPADIT